MPDYNIEFQPQNLKLEVPEGTTIKEAIDQAGIDFVFPCGGEGKCGKCRVKVTSGAGKPSTTEQEFLTEEELSTGFRLACLTKIYRNTSVEIINHTPYRANILTAAGERSYRLEPHLKKLLIKPAKPSLDDPRSDWQRLKDELAANGCSHSGREIPVSVLRCLPETARKDQPYHTAILYNHKVVGLEKQDTTGTMLGMAFDIGTTTIVGYLLDMYTGQELSVVSTLNPQARFGADVISRIKFAGQEDGLNKLHTAVIEAVNKLIGEAVNKAGVDREQIYTFSIAANTCMHHLLLGINPRNIAEAPYVPAVTEPLVISASELGIKINQAGKVFVLPNIAGFVGADTTAVLLDTELDRSEDIKLVIDIGTNGEIVLGSSQGMIACSTAAGPALEGAEISYGMRGTAGAIDHVFFADQLNYSVIGGVSPVGICGSGLLDTVAGLLECGIIDKRGRIQPAGNLTGSKAQKFKEHITEHGGQRAFLLAGGEKTGHGRPVTINQQDIRELQSAKGAIAAGIKVLIETYGIGVNDIKEVLLSGAFGNYLNPHSACVIGLIPPELEDKIKIIGNAAGTGAKLALLSASEYTRASGISKSVEFVELGSYPQFNSIFAKCSYLN